MKDYTAKPSACNLIQQQRRFNGFRTEYNEYRPHEALDMQTPSEHYNGSVRKFPSRLPQINYPDHMQIRTVQIHNNIRYFGKRLFVTECLYGENVGIERIDDNVSLLWYCDYLLGRIDHRKWQIGPVKNRPLSSAASCGAERT